MSSSRDLDRLSDNLKARTAELGRQIGESTASQGTTTDLLAKIAELRARTERTSTAVPALSPVKPAS
jgi:hypothetical protein